MSSDFGGAVVLLSSGQTVRMRAVLLYDADELSDISNLRRQATQKLGGVSSGIGFLGSPSWVIGASVATSIIESALSSGVQKQGLQLLQAADARSKALVDKGRYCDIARIDNAHLPHPASWSCEVDVRLSVDLGKISWGERSNFLKKHNRTKADVHDNFVEIVVTRRMVHTGDDFVQMDTDIGPLSIRWSHVTAYSYPKPSNAPVLAELSSDCA